MLFFLGKTDKMLPKSWFSKPIFGRSAGSTKLDRPYCKQFWFVCDSKYRKQNCGCVAVVHLAPHNRTVAGAVPECGIPLLVKYARAILDYRSGTSPLVLPTTISGPQKGPAERGHVKNRQKVSKIFSTLFDSLRAGQKTSKIVKKCQKHFRHFSTIFARHRFPALFGGLWYHGVHNDCSQLSFFGN